MEIKVVVEILENGGFEIDCYITLFIDNKLDEDVENIVSDFMQKNYFLQEYNFYIIEDHYEIEWQTTEKINTFNEFSDFICTNNLLYKGKGESRPFVKGFYDDKPESFYKEEIEKMYDVKLNILK